MFILVLFIEPTGDITKPFLFTLYPFSNAFLTAVLLKLYGFIIFLFILFKMCRDFHPAVFNYQYKNLF